MGRPYDLNRAFHVGSGRLAPAALPIVLKHWREMLRRRKDAGDCARMTSDEATELLQGGGLSLGVTRSYLIFYLEVAHAATGCFPPVQVPLAALASLADRAELQRLGPPFAVE